MLVTHPPGACFSAEGFTGPLFQFLKQTSSRRGNQGSERTTASLRPQAGRGERPACLPACAGPPGWDPRPTAPGAPTGEVLGGCGVGLGAAESRGNLGLTGPRFCVFIQLRFPLAWALPPVLSRATAAPRVAGTWQGQSRSQRTRNLLRAVRGAGRRGQVGRGRLGLFLEGAGTSADLPRRRGWGGPRVLGRTARGQGRAGAARGGAGADGGGYALGSEHAGRAGSGPQSKVHSWSWAGKAGVPCSPCFLPSPAPRSPQTPPGLCTQRRGLTAAAPARPWWTARLRGAALS